MPRATSGSIAASLLAVTVLSLTVGCSALGPRPAVTPSFGPTATTPSPAGSPDATTTARTPSPGLTGSPTPPTPLPLPAGPTQTPRHSAPPEPSPTVVPTPFSAVVYTETPVEDADDLIKQLQPTGGCETDVVPGDIPDYRAMARGVDEGLLSDGRSWVGEPGDAYRWMSAFAVFVSRSTGEAVVVARMQEGWDWLKYPSVGDPVALPLYHEPLRDGRDVWVPGLSGYSWSCTDWPS